jgi:PEP-CTERM/exosortase A-associated glycosyltransferase
MAPDLGTILHVFDHSFPINDGYAFRSGEIIRFLRRSGWRTSHVTSPKQGPTTTSRETVDGLDFQRTQPSSSLARLPILNQYGIVRNLRRGLHGVIREQRPALMHVHSPCLNGLAALPLAQRFTLPMLYEVRALWEDGAVDNGTCEEGDLRYRISRMLETYVCRHADHVVTICDGLRTELIGRGLNPARITVVPNSVDLDHFAFASTGKLTPALPGVELTPGKTFGFVGTFFPFEGLEVLLRAVPLILAREPHAKFVLVGDGPDGARIRQLARDLAIQDAVRLTGRVPHGDVVRYYDGMDVLIYPRVSNRVTELVTPLKPLEAMARSKLVVASNVGGHREMVFHGNNGMLFEAGNPASLAKACLQLLSREQEWDRLRESGREYVRKARCWEQNVKIYDRLYRQMVAGPSGVSPFSR